MSGTAVTRGREDVRPRKRKEMEGEGGPIGVGVGDGEHFDRGDRSREVCLGFWVDTHSFGARVKKMDGDDGLHYGAHGGSRVSAASINRRGGWRIDRPGMEALGLGLGKLLSVQAPGRQCGHTSSHLTSPHF